MSTLVRRAGDSCVQSGVPAEGADFSLSGVDSMSMIGIVRGAGAGAERRQFPATIEEFRRAGASFADQLRALKQRISIPGDRWYPYESILAVPLISALISPVFDEISEAVAVRPVADIGCADGDCAMWFAGMGCEVDAIDHAPTNFNQFRGARLLARELSLAVNTLDIDLDRPFDLPRADYALALFLGTLYHLKNPLYVLEVLAARADWCILSTRIARVTPVRRIQMEEEPLAYLLGAREANNDPTNYWIFSFPGLMRLMERAGWSVVQSFRQGCIADSNPVEATADERAFVLAKSHTRNPGLQVRRLEGWHTVENESFRWTAKHFAMEVTVPEGSREFALSFWVPEAALISGPICLSCVIAGNPAGTIICDAESSLEFRGRFPPAGTTFRLEFSVASHFHSDGDSRELGVCIPLLDESQRHLQRIPFRIS